MVEIKQESDAAQNAGVHIPIVVTSQAKAPPKADSPSKVDLVESLISYTPGWDYERELSEKMTFVRERFQEMVSLEEQNKLEVFRSPSRHFRFRTKIKVIPRGELEAKILSHESRREWLDALRSENIEERRRLEESEEVKNGISSVAKGHFVMFDSSGLASLELPGRKLVACALEPERMSLSTLSKGIQHILEDDLFLQLVWSELYIEDRGLVVISLHSTVANENDILSGGRGVVGGMICSFILDSPSGFAEISLAGFVQHFPHVRFVVQAKDSCKSMLGDRLISTAEADVGSQPVMSAKEVIQHCLLDETLRISGRDCKYTQVFDSFSNPNPYIAIATGQWLQSIVNKYGMDTSKNLLELYCGIGSHTIVLGHSFDNIVAVEIDPNLVQMLKDNVKKNNEYFLCKDDESVVSQHENETQHENEQKTTIYPIRAPSEHFCRKIMKSRKYNNLEFDWILVDPPRAGLDDITLKLIVNYSHILYISCNPAALRRDLDKLLSEFELVEFCLLDHFPFTPHLENGVYLRRKNRSQ